MKTNEGGQETLKNAPNNYIIILILSVAENTQTMENGFHTDQTNQCTNCQGKCLLSRNELKSILHRGN